MKAENQIFSNEFLLKLKDFTLGYFDNNQFNDLVQKLTDASKEFIYSKSAEANLFRVLSNVYDKVSLLSDMRKFPHYVQILFTITFNSNYLTDIIVRNPEFLYWILNSDNLSKSLNLQKAKANIRDSISNFKTINAKLNTLRNFKRREILRIGLKDIMGISSLKETNYQLSILAKAINSELFELCYSDVLSNYNLEIPDKKYCLAALGKLGGEELNYSSDVDMILFFDSNDIIGDSKKEYFEILTEATHNYIQNSTELTDKGYIYRVDFRLRPDGRNSLLCRTLKDFIQYYESRGEDWERQMLIKLSFTGGSKELYDIFYDSVEHFIYPKSFSKSPLKQVAVMKKNIEKRLESDDDIKLFEGGIRDIEFSVQALQLVNGGNIEQIRSGNTLEALLLLYQNNLLSENEYNVLSSAYKFYRKTENYLQLLNDTQTHTIPRNENILDQLSNYLKLNNKEDFFNKLNDYRKEVRKIFNSIINLDQEINSISISDINFFEKNRAENNFKFLQTGQGLLQQKVFDKSTITAFKNLETDLLKKLKRSNSPDLILENFAKIIKRTSLPSIWYHEFSDSNLFDAFLTICEKSQKAVEILITNKTIGELLLSRKIFASKLEHHFELSIDEMIFILAVQDALEIISPSEFTLILGNFLTHKIQNICKSTKLKYNYFIYGMGSLASYDVTFNSDIDIVFIGSEIDKYNSIQNDFAKLLSEITEKLRPFEVDSRLRPEGKNAQLLWDIHSYEEYIINRMQIWELQSLTKSRFIFGNTNLFERFIKKINERIDNLENKYLKDEILFMRKKISQQLSQSPQSSFNNFFNIKKSRGGLIDIEFALQYLLLSRGEDFLKNLNNSTIQILDFYAEKKLDNYNFEKIKSNFLFLKRLEIKLQNSFNIHTHNVPVDKLKREQLSLLMGYKNIYDFETALNKILNENRTFFENIVGLK